MQEASLIGAIKIILIILLIYFGIKIIFKWFGPLILKYFMKKLGEQAFQNFNQGENAQSPFQQNRTQQKTKENIGKKKSNSRNENKEVGEYIDFEEIE